MAILVSLDAENQRNGLPVWEKERRNTWPLNKSVKSTGVMCAEMR